MQLLLKTFPVSPENPPSHPIPLVAPCFTKSTDHPISSFYLVWYILTKSQNQKCQLKSRQTKVFHRFNVHCLCFCPNQFLLVCLSDSFFAVTWLSWLTQCPVRLLLELWEAIMWGAASCWGSPTNSNELVLCRRGWSVGLLFLRPSSWDLVSSQHLLVFGTALEETFKVVMDCQWWYLPEYVMDAGYDLYI